MLLNPPPHLLSLTGTHCCHVFSLPTVDGEPFRAFCALGASMVKAALGNLGWSERPEDSHTDKLLRATVVGLLPGKVVV